MYYVSLRDHVSTVVLAAHIHVLLLYFSCFWVFVLCCRYIHLSKGSEYFFDYCMWSKLHALVNRLCYEQCRKPVLQRVLKRMCIYFSDKWIICRGDLDHLCPWQRYFGSNTLIMLGTVSSATVEGVVLWFPWDRAVVERIALFIELYLSYVSS